MCDVNVILLDIATPGNPVRTNDQRDFGDGVKLLSDGGIILEDKIRYFL